MRSLLGGRAESLVLGQRRECPTVFFDKIKIVHYIILMAKTMTVRITPQIAKKINKIMEGESLSQFIQRRLCETAGIPYEEKSKPRRGKPGLSLKTSGTTIYLDDQAEKALEILKKNSPGGFSFQGFVLNEIRQY